MKKEELDGRHLAGKTVIVLDILFATSTIVTALAHGAAEVCPALDSTDARAEAARREHGSYVLSGEAFSRDLPGFARPTPLALTRHGLRGKSVIYSTTNGTVALRGAAGAARVYAGALLNGAALVEHVRREPPTDAIVILCSGSMNRFALEDYYGAGYLVSLFAHGGAGEVQLSDAALGAQLLHDRIGALDCLSRGYVGRMMLERGLRAELEFACRKDEFDVVPELSSWGAGSGSDARSALPSLQPARKRAMTVGGERPRTRP